MPLSGGRMVALKNQLKNRRNQTIQACFLMEMDRLEIILSIVKIKQLKLCNIDYTPLIYCRTNTASRMAGRFDLIIICSYIMEGTASKIEDEAVELKPKVSPELVKKYRQIFDSFDKEQDGYVQAKDVPGVLRILGVIMSEQEVVDALGDKAIKSDNPLVSSKIDFADFLALVVDKQGEMTMKEELMESFRVFDVDRNGSILVSELRYFLRTYGVAMSEEEVEQLLKESEPEDGYVKYEKFIDKMLDKA